MNLYIRYLYIKIYLDNENKFCLFNEPNKYSKYRKQLIIRRKIPKVAYIIQVVVNCLMMEKFRPLGKHSKRDTLKWIKSDKENYIR